MSKKSSAPTLPAGTPMEGRVIYDYQIQALEGRILTFIESLGLRESQEKSAKDIFRELFYRGMYNETLWVNGDMLGPVVTAAYKEATDLQQPHWCARYVPVNGK